MENLNIQIEELWKLTKNIIKKMKRPQRLFKIEPDNAALLVIDMQNAFCLPSGCLENPDSRKIINNINLLTEACHKLSIPVIWIKLTVNQDLSNAGLWPHFQPASPHGHHRNNPPEALSVNGKEIDLYEQLNINKRDYQIVKCRYSAFISGSSNIERTLRTLNRNTVIITGVGTNVCCESTARDAMMLDFNVIFVSDANATFNPIFHEISLMNIKLFFGDVVTTFELLNTLKSS